MLHTSTMVTTTTTSGPTTTTTAGPTTTTTTTTTTAGGTTTTTTAQSVSGIIVDRCDGGSSVFVAYSGAPYMVGEYVSVETYSGSGIWFCAEITNNDTVGADAGFILDMTGFIDCSDCESYYGMP